MLAYMVVKIMSESFCGLKGNIWNSMIIWIIIKYLFQNQMAQVLLEKCFLIQ